MPAPELHFVRRSGPTEGESRRMAYWQWGPADAPHAVVCVHGLTRQGRDFDVLAQALVAAARGGLRVICPDVAGRGHSDWLSDPQHYAVPTYVGDMLALLGRLHEQAPLKRLGWVGTSMGGLIGMGVCGTPDLPLPVPVQRLVINDIGPVLEWSGLARIASYVGQLVRFDTEQQGADALAVLAAGFGPHSPDAWMALSRPMLRPLAEGGFGLHYDPAIAVPLRDLTQESTLEGEPALWRLWDRITAQTLLVRGAESDLLSPDTAQAMTQRGPRAHLIEWAGVGHAPTFVPSHQVEPVVSFLLS